MTSYFRECFKSAFLARLLVQNCLSVPKQLVRQNMLQGGNASSSSQYYCEETSPFLPYYAVKRTRTRKTHVRAECTETWHTHISDAATNRTKLNTVCDFSGRHLLDIDRRISICRLHTSGQFVRSPDRLTSLGCTCTRECISCSACWIYPWLHHGRWYCSMCYEGSYHCLCLSILQSCFALLRKHVAYISSQLVATARIGSSPASREELFFLHNGGSA